MRLLNIKFGEPSIVEQVHIARFVRNRIEQFLLPVMVDNEIVGNPQHPGQEFAFIVIPYPC
jgi:hypothetical protein